MTVRRAVLGDDHVERAVATTTSFTEPFQDFINRAFAVAQRVLSEVGAGE